MGAHVDDLIYLRHPVTTYHLSAEESSTNCTAAYSTAPTTITTPHNQHELQVTPPQDQV
jgi:hypothetical protein